MSSDLYLSDTQEQRVISAIAEAERTTSGEIRVHIESTCPGEPLDRAARVFHELGMDETRQQNGVLIYLAAEDHKAAVYAGKGIHRQVEEDFWDRVLALLLEHFRKDEFEQGIVAAVRQVGEQLGELFPFRAGDIDELTNEISYRDDAGE